MPRASNIHPGRRSELPLENRIQVLYCRPRTKTPRHSSSGRFSSTWKIARTQPLSKACASRRAGPPPASNVDALTRRVRGRPAAGLEVRDTHAPRVLNDVVDVLFVERPAAFVVAFAKGDIEIRF